MITPEMARKGVRLRQQASVDLMYYVFNMSDSLVGGNSPKKRALRQAISLAIDSQTSIDLFSQGVGIPAQGPVPPGLFGYDPNYKNPYRQFNIAKAKQLLVQAGYPGGIDPATGQALVLNYDNAAATPDQRQEVELIHKELARIGINCVSRTVRDIAWQQKLDQGQFQFTHYGWIADYPDPENFFLLFYSKNVRPGPNYAGYNNPEFDKLYEQMRAMSDGPERLAIIIKMRDMLAEDCPMVFDQHEVTMSLYYDWLHNVNPSPIAMDTPQYTWVDSRLRADREAKWNRPVYWPVTALMIFVVLGSIPAAKVVRERRTRYIRRGGGK
jgi:ABC-type transport system substrate-binding protein